MADYDEVEEHITDGLKETDFEENYLDKNGRPLVVHPKLASVVGLNESIIIMQINYWMKKSKYKKEGKKWCRFSFEKWEKQFPFWHPVTIRKIFNRVEKSGYIISKCFNHCRFDRTKWYTTNNKKINESLKVFHPSKNDKKIKFYIKKKKFSRS